MPVQTTTTPTSAPASLVRHQNRLKMVLLHTTRYAFEGQARLAADVGVSRSTICRLISGRSSPTFRLAQAVTSALERDLGVPLVPCDLFSPDGTYPTASTCALCRCSGCLPEEAYDAKLRLRSEFQYQKPGQWSHFPQTSATLALNHPA